MRQAAIRFFSITLVFSFFLTGRALADTPPPTTSTSKLSDGTTRTTEKTPESEGRTTTTTKLEDGTKIERSTLPGGVRETKITKPDGSWVVTRKGFMGVVTTSKDQKGNLVTTMERSDGSGFERYTAGDTKVTRQTDYDTEGKPVKTTKVDGDRTEETTYDKDGKPDKTTVSEKGEPVEEITYDKNGEVKDRKDLRKPDKDKDKGKEPELPLPEEPGFGPGSISARDLQFDTSPEGRPDAEERT